MPISPPNFPIRTDDLVEYIGGYVDESTVFTIPSIEAWGHSWMADYNVLNKYGIVERLASGLGDIYATQMAQSGATIAGINDYNAAGKVLADPDLHVARLDQGAVGEYITPGGLKMVLNGYNDFSAWAGQGANGIAIVESALRVGFAGLLGARLIPTADDTGAALNAAELTFSSTHWTAQVNTTTGRKSHAYTDTNGAYIEWTADAGYLGEAITIILTVSGGIGGYDAAVSVDGVDQGVTVDTQPFYDALVGAGITGSPVCVRIPENSARVPGDVIRVTISSIPGGAYAAVQGFMIEGRAPMAVLKHPRRPGVAIGAGVNPGVVWANARIDAVVDEFPTAFTVDLEPGVSPNWGAGGAAEASDERYWLDAYHLNQLGYGRATAEVLKAIRRNVTIDQMGQMTMLPDPRWRTVGPNFGDYVPFADAQYHTLIGYTPTAFRRVRDMTELQGVFGNFTGTAGASTTGFTLPEGFRPKDVVTAVFGAMHEAGYPARLDVNGNGNVFMYVALATSTYRSLDGISFRAR